MDGPWFKNGGKPTPVSPKAPLPSELLTVLSSGIGESTSSAGVSSPAAAGGTLIAMGIGKLTGSSEQKEKKKGLKECEKQGHSVSGRCYCCRIEISVQIDYAGAAAMTNEFIYRLNSAIVIKKSVKIALSQKQFLAKKGLHI